MAEEATVVIEGNINEKSNASKAFEQAPIKSIDIKAGKDGKYKCPECGNKLESRLKLGYHRRVKHGVAGTAPSTISGRKKKQEDKSSSGEYKCSECGKRFEDRRKLGIHRFNEHKIHGYTYRGEKLQTKDNKEKFLCPECGSEYSSPTGLGRHRQAIHGIIGKSHTAIVNRNARTTQIVSIPQEQPHINNSRGGIVNVESSSRFTIEGIPEAAYAYCYGKCETILDTYAKENGLPALELTRRVAELLLRAARR